MIISAEEHNDGAAFINGEYVSLNGKSETRCRYTSRYNFIITAKGSPFNQLDEGQDLQERFMNKILNGTETVENFVKAADLLPKDTLLG
jgi:hypothetical protein